MKTDVTRVLVTGGAGFIGSHIVDALMKGNSRVSVFDNLSSGTLQNIERWLNDPNFTFVKGDLLNLNDLTRLTEGRYDVVFHLAANPEVRVSSVNPNVHFQQNVVATYNLLEYLRKTDAASTLAFSSTSTVYGDASEIPTPESYAPLKPISVYGATKLASEALIAAYAYAYGFKTVIYRLANVVGPRSRHGVIYDFVKKLRANPRELEILGDGSQTKSYIYVDDCVKAMLLGLDRSESQVGVYNVGSEDQVDVKTVADIIVQEMGLKDVKYKFTGGVNGGRGWRGDVKNMLLDVTKLKSLGWRPKLNSKQAVRKAAGDLLAELRLKRD